MHGQVVGGITKEKGAGPVQKANEEHELSELHTHIFEVGLPLPEKTKPVHVNHAMAAIPRGMDATNTGQREEKKATWSARGGQEVAARVSPPAGAAEGDHPSEDDEANEEAAGTFLGF